jgi:hypothetical protein
MGAKFAGRTILLAGAKEGVEGCPRPSSRILHAYHEAGHAVAAAALEVPFNYVTIVREGSVFGHVSLAPDPLSYRGMFRRLVIVAAGGRAVEILTAGRSTTSHEDAGSVRYWDGGTSGDRRESVRLIGKIAAENDIEFALGTNIDFLLGVYSLQVEAAESLVCWHWPAVIRVAEALLAEKTLTEAGVHELLGPVPIS